MPVLHHGALDNLPARIHALLQAKGLGRDDETLLRRLRFDHEAVPLRECQDFALRWAAPLAALSSGAHRVDARPPVDWQKGFSHNGVTLLVARDLINASTIEVRRRLSQGDPLGAVRLSPTLRIRGVLK